MRRIGSVTAVILALTLVAWFSLASNGSSATITLRDYASPSSPTMQLLNQVHLDGIKDGTHFV